LAKEVSKKGPGGQVNGEEHGGGGRPTNQKIRNRKAIVLESQKIWGSSISRSKKDIGGKGKK